MEQIELAEHSRVAIGTILAGFEPEPARFGPEPGHAVKRLHTKVCSASPLKSSALRPRC